VLFNPKSLSIFDQLISFCYLQIDPSRQMLWHIFKLRLIALTDKMFRLFVIFLKPFKTYGKMLEGKLLLTQILTECKNGSQKILNFYLI